MMGSALNMSLLSNIGLYLVANICSFSGRTEYSNINASLRLQRIFSTNISE